MRKNNLKVEKFLDGERLFKYYYEVMGDARSTSKLVEWCKTQGMVNSKGKSPTRMGVWLAMWRYALKNEQQARKFYEGEKFSEIDNPPMKDSEWLDLLKQRAYTCYYGGKTYENWCRQHNMSL